MKTRDIIAIVLFIAFFLGVFGAGHLLGRLLFPGHPASTEDPAKAERETKQQVANADSASAVFWKDLALQYRHIADSLMLIPSQTTINDAVTSMHSAPVDSVQRVLLSEPR